MDINLRKLRASLNLSQSEMADQLGISQVSLSRYETGAIEIPPYIEKLIEVLYLGKGSGAAEKRIRQLETENRELKEELKKIDETMDEIRERHRRNRRNVAGGLSGA